MIKNIIKFVDQVKLEVRKVMWPSSKTLIISTSVVLVAVAVFSITFLFIDYSIHKIILFLLKFGR